MCVQRCLLSFQGGHPGNSVSSENFLRGVNGGFSIEDGICGDSRAMQVTCLQVLYYTKTYRIDISGLGNHLNIVESQSMFDDHFQKMPGCNVQ